MRQRKQEEVPAVSYTHLDVYKRQILDAGEAHEMEPNLSYEVVAAIYCPTGGIVCPFVMNIAFAENAAANGVEFLFNTEVKEIQKEHAGYILITQNGEIHARCVVNAEMCIRDRQEMSQTVFWTSLIRWKRKMTDYTPQCL